MKLVRYGAPGKEKPGLIDAGGKLRSLADIIDDIGPQQLSDQSLRKLGRVKHDFLPLVRGKPRFGVPLNGVGKFIAIGLNHAAKAGLLGMGMKPQRFLKRGDQMRLGIEGLGEREQLVIPCRKA